MSKSIPYIIIFSLVVLIFFIGCPGKEVVYIEPKESSKASRDSSGYFRQQAEKEKHRADSMALLKAKVRHHWHTIKHDSLIPVPVLVQVCDSALAADSVHSAIQELVILNQDGEIKHLREVIRIDSTNSAYKVDSLITANKGLKKEVRKQKIQKWLIGAAWLVREGVGLSR